MPTERGKWFLGRIWPRSARPAVVVSIDTGYARHLNSLTFSRLGDIWADGCILRLFRVLMNSRSVHSQNSWDAFMYHLYDHVRGDYFRINHLFDSKEPSLDDVDRIPELQRQVRSQLALKNDVSATARALWASQFFFELDEVCKYHLGAYQCHGSILCKATSSRALLGAIQAAFLSP